MEWYTVRAVLKIFVDRELLTAWGTCRSTIVTPALSPTIYKVRLISRTRSVVLPTRVWNIGRELAETAYEVKFRSNITDFVRRERGSSWSGKFRVFEQPKIFRWVSSFIFCQFTRPQIRTDRPIVRCTGESTVFRLSIPMRLLFVCKLSFSSIKVANTTDKIDRFGGFCATAFQHRLNFSSAYHLAEALVEDRIYFFSK